MVLAIVRHAESVENADKYKGFYYEQRPYAGEVAHHLSKHIVGLTAVGFLQALWLRDAFASLSSSRVCGYHSTYRRAKDTAAIAFQRLESTQVTCTQLLDEQYYAEATYMTKKELFSTYPEHVHMRTQQKHHWAPPGGGEALAKGVLRRARKFLYCAQRDIQTGRDVIAITHHTTILALRSLLEHRTLTEVVDEARQQKTGNAHILWYTYTTDAEFCLQNVSVPAIE